MATWLEHIKFSFGGEIGTPALEQWSNTVRFKIAMDDDPDNSSRIMTSGELDEALGLLNTPLQAWFHNENSAISAVAKLTWAKLNMIGTDGKQMDQNTHRIDTGVVLGGIQAQFTVPWFQTLAITHRTDLQRGRSHSGRIFPPLIVANPAGTSPYVSENQADAIATSWSTALNAFSTILRNIEGDGVPGLAVSCYPVVASPAATTGPNQGGPLLRRVTGVVVDRVQDVQHRRTAQVPRVEGHRVAVVGA